MVTTNSHADVRVRVRVRDSIYRNYTSSLHGILCTLPMCVSRCCPGGVVYMYFRFLDDVIIAHNDQE